MSLTALHPAPDTEAGGVGSTGAAPDWTATLAGGVMLTVFALTPVVAYVGNLGFAPLVALAGIVALPAAVRRRGARFGPLILVALLAWALTSLAWSPWKPKSLSRPKDLMAFTGLKLVFELAFYSAFVAAAARVRADRARLCLVVLGIGLTAVVVLLLAEAASGAALYQAIKGAIHSFTRPDLARRNVARAAYPLALLIWPAALMLNERGWRSMALLAGFGGGAAALALNVDAPVAALAAGGLTWLAVSAGGRVGLWAALGCAIGYFALAPVAILLVEHALPAHGGAGADAVKLSWGARLDIWRFVTDRIVEHPMRGWGLDASRAWPGVIPLHPHDGALQLWLELGAPGALLAALTFAWIFSWLASERERDRELAAAGAASAAAYLVIGALSFGVWQEWWLALGAVSWAAVLLAKRARAAEHPQAGSDMGSPVQARPDRMER